MKTPEDHSGGFQPWFGKWLWANCLTFLGCNFFIYIIEIIVSWEYPTQYICPCLQHVITFQRVLNGFFFLMHYSSLLLCTHKRSYKSSTTSQRSFKTGLQTQSCTTFVGWITVAKPILLCLDLKSIQEWNCILLCSLLRMSFHFFFFFLPLIWAIQSTCSLWLEVLLGIWSTSSV